MVSRQLVALLLTWFAAVIWAGEPENLVLNPGFDGSIADWIPPSVFLDVSWSDLDSNVDGASGSVRITHDFSGNGTNFRFISQCVPVEQDKTYRFGSQVLIPLGQGDAELSAHVLVARINNGTCTGRSLGSALDNGMPIASMDWQSVEGRISTGTFDRAISIGLTIEKSSGFEDDVTVYFDNVFLEELGDDVFLSGFELEL